jgi:hypothetical protein
VRGLQVGHHRIGREPQGGATELRQEQNGQDAAGRRHRTGGESVRLFPVP